MAWPLAAFAQQGERIPRVAILMGLAEDDPETKARLGEFRKEIEKFGWSEGQNVRFDIRFAPGGVNAQALAKELIALKPDVILAHSAQVAGVVQRETRTIPVVFVNVSDPIGAGFIESLARPGGNLTGVLHYEVGILGKWLAMLKEIAPRVTRAALMADPKSPVFNYFVRAAESGGRSLGIEIVPTPVERAADIEWSIEAFARVPNGGLLLPPDITTLTHRDLIIGLAAKHSLPAIYPFRLFVVKGGLMSYGPTRLTCSRRPPRTSTASCGARTLLRFRYRRPPSTRRRLT
jgi:putative ABC transport system substrate-binding protein